MEFTYETQGANSFLVYAIGEKEEIDTLTLGMITNNKISGFLPAMFTQVNDTQYVKYNISSKISADQVFAGTVMKKQLLGIFLGISEAMLAAEDYMIPLNSLVLDLKHIYVDVSTYKAKLVCIPSTELIKQDSLNVFLKNIMFNTRFDGSENTDYVARIISKLNASSSMSMNEFKDMIALLKNELSMDEQMGMLSQELGAWEYEKVFRDKIDSDNSKENLIANEGNVQKIQDMSNGQGIPNGLNGQMQGMQNVQGMQGVQNVQGMQGGQNGQMQGMQYGQGIQNRQNRQMQGMQYGLNGSMQNMQGTLNNKKIKKEKKKKTKDGVTNAQSQMPNTNTMMNIPGQNGTINSVNSNTNSNKNSNTNGSTNAAASQASGEEKISLGHLLMHFNSENMAKYKEQKAENKKQKKVQTMNGNNMVYLNNSGNASNMGGMNNANYMGNMNVAGNMQSQNVQSQTIQSQNMQSQTMQSQNIQSQTMQSQNMQSQNMQSQNIQNMGQQMSNVGQNITSMAGNMQNSNFGETIVLNSGTIGETVVLDSLLQNNSIMPYLVRKKTGERVNITKPIFHIGKERSYADYFIADNSAISRSHANILLKNNKCFVMDTNSTNHTYVDGTMIPCNVEVELCANNILKLADEEFEVHLV